MFIWLEIPRSRDLMAERRYYAQAFQGYGSFSQDEVLDHTPQEQGGELSVAVKIKNGMVFLSYSSQVFGQKNE